MGVWPLNEREGKRLGCVALLQYCSTYIILLTWQLTINQPHCLQKVTDEAAAMSKERIETTKSPETLDRQIKQLTRLLATEKDR